MTILLWRLLKIVTFYNIIRRFLNCHNLHVKYGGFNRHFLNRNILHVKYNGFNRHILINLNNKIFSGSNSLLSLKIFPLSFFPDFFPLFSTLHFTFTILYFDFSFPILSLASHLFQHFNFSSQHFNFSSPRFQASQCLKCLNVSSSRTFQARIFGHFTLASLFAPICLVIGKFKKKNWFRVLSSILIWLEKV